MMTNDFQKPAACRVYAQGRRLCYVGRMHAVGLHAHATEAWLFGLDGPFHIALASGAGQSCRSAVVPTGLPHRLRVGGGRLVVVYLDPLADQPGLSDRSPQLLIPHPAQAAFLDVLERLTAGQAPETEFWPLLDAMLTVRRDIDARLQSVVHMIERRVDANMTAVELAECVNLSPSRLIHLMHADMGVSLRRYRLFERMRRSVLDIHGGKPLTHTALDLGFSTPSHFSASFRTMFGVAPSAALLGRTAPQPGLSSE